MTLIMMRWNKGVRLRCLGGSLFVGSELPLLEDGGHDIGRKDAMS